MVKQEIQDLNLEEMFDVFEKADKTVAGAPATSAPPRPSAPKTAGGKSASVPYLPAPKNLDGLVGNKGFDPIGFSDSLDVRWLREAELKHGRIGKFVLPLLLLLFLRAPYVFNSLADSALFHPTPQPCSPFWAGS